MPRRKGPLGGRVLYDERLWPPAWFVALAFCVPSGLGALACPAASAVGQKAVWTSVFPWFAGCGVVFAALLVTRATRKVEVREPEAPDLVGGGRVVVLESLGGRFAHDPWRA